MVDDEDGPPGALVQYHRSHLEGQFVHARHIAHARNSHRRHVPNSIVDQGVNYVLDVALRLFLDCFALFSLFQSVFCLHIAYLTQLFLRKGKQALIYLQASAVALTSFVVVTQAHQRHFFSTIKLLRVFSVGACEPKHAPRGVAGLHWESASKCSR